MPDFVRFVGSLVLPGTKRSPVSRYLIGLLAPFLAAVLTGFFADVQRAPFFPLFTAAVVISSVLGGLRSGYVALILSVFINVLSVPPFMSLRIAVGGDAVRIATFAVVDGIVVTFIGVAGQLQSRVEFERARLDTTLRSIGDGVITTDATGRVTFINAVAEEATGWKIEDACGLSLETVFKIVNETTRAVVPNPMRRVLAEGRIVGLANHTVLIRKDGTEMPIDDSAAPIRAGGEILGVVLVFRDVTEARLQQEALLRAEKLASVGRLASTISHEINNPLEAISNLLYLVQRDAMLSPSSKDWLALASDELQRAIEVTRQTLSFHRGDRSFAQVDVADVVEAVFRVYATRAKTRGVELVNLVAPGTTVWGLSAELRQVMGNLISNAIDVMPHGGSFTVTAQKTDGDRVCIAFRDTGTGIVPDHLERIFDPFFTTKAETGTGLGLWVTKTIVEHHNGKISVTSSTESDNSGTEFVVELPSQAEASAASGRE